MYHIYDKIKIRKTGEEGVILGIMPNPFKKSKFICLVVLKHKRAWIAIEKISTY